jgi:hypothetical protein
MFATIVGNRVYVRLSRRNLQDLQDMLHDQDTGPRWLGRAGENGLSLIVEVEDDAEHYEGRKPGPGLRRVA